jgi:hypothetical protein
MWSVKSLALVLTLTLGRGALAQTGKSAPAPTPDDALKAYDDGRLAAFAADVEGQLRRELSQNQPRNETVVRLATLRAFAGRLAAVKPAAADEATLRWLIKQPALGPLLLTALSPRDNPARVLSVLTALRAKYGKAVETFPELAVAACVVWDSPARENQTPAQATQAACDVFGHLTQNRQALRYDPKALPWPVLIYLVDSRVTPAERRWALNTYRLPRDPGTAYFQIRYDMGAYFSGQWKGGGAENYTLPKIMELGGVCKDQAYFTAEVCRAYGVPAVVCTGQSGAGEGFHAWVGIYKIVQRRAVFDFQTARYPEHGFWSGTVIDPQTGDKFADSEVSMVAEWGAVTPAKRLFSNALTQSLDLLDSKARVKVCKAALEASPGNARAWMALVNECTNPQTPAATVGEVTGVIERFAVGRYDDFAFKALTTFVGVRPPEEQFAAIDRLAKLFPSRPDLLADLALRKGDALRDSGRPVDALRLYQGVLEEALHYGPLSLEAIGRIDAMLRGAGRTRELAEHYRIAWTHMKTPESSGYIATTPWYIMGDHFAKVLEEMGDTPGAARVRETLRSHDRSSAPPGEKR